MGSLIDEPQRREAAARAEAEELRGRIAEPWSAGRAGPVRARRGQRLAVPSRRAASSGAAAVVRYVAGGAGFWWRCPAATARQSGVAGGSLAPWARAVPVGLQVTETKPGKAVPQVSARRSGGGRARGCGPSALPAVVTAAFSSAHVVPLPRPAPPPGNCRKLAPSQRPGRSPKPAACPGRLPRVSPWSCSA